MRHEDNLAALLRPLGVYDLREGTVNRGELAAWGAALDQAQDLLDDAAREGNLASAEDWGLERVEALLPYRPVCQTPRERREALAALLRIGGDSFTVAGVNDTLRGCGLNARAEDGDQPGHVTVSFPDVAGIPEGFQRLRAIIEDILPCHLGVTYSFWYNTWAALGARYPSWALAAARGLSWYGLATEKA